MKKRGFTLIELLAVIVILGVLVYIASTKIISVKEDSKEKSFFASAKAILRQIDYDNVETNTMAQTNLSTFNLNIKATEYDINNSYVYMTNGELFITLIGIGDYAGLYICNLSIDNDIVTVQNTACS